MFNFNITQRGKAPRAPIDNSLCAIDELFLVESLENREYCPREAFIHSETLATPIDTIA